MCNSTARDSEDSFLPRSLVPDHMGRRRREAPGCG